MAVVTTPAIWLVPMICGLVQAVDMSVCHSVPVSGPVVRGRALLCTVRVCWQMRECQLHGHWGRANQHSQPTDELPVSTSSHTVVHNDPVRWTVANLLGPSG
jgi:hypothetical protein